MAYSQVRDIIDHVKAFHRKLQHAFEQLADETDDERARLLLELLEDYEDELKRVLARYASEEHSGVVETWIQYDPIDELRAALAESELAPGMPLERLVEQTLRLNQAIIEFYRQAADQVAAPRAQELFEALLTLEQSKNARYAQTALELVDGGELSSGEPPRSQGD
ncbi:MAG TPA: hypothetical protein VML55_02905 [Planctomycetaceae bacterium]|nr:hypothetical protein [Planctomycetaceae bacterium]